MQWQPGSNCTKHMTCFFTYGYPHRGNLQKESPRFGGGISAGKNHSEVCLQSEQDKTTNKGNSAKISCRVCPTIGGSGGLLEQTRLIKRFRSQLNVIHYRPNFLDTLIDHLKIDPKLSPPCAKLVVVMYLRIHIPSRILLSLLRGLFWELQSFWCNLSASVKNLSRFLLFSN